MGLKILITGANGFVGCHLIEKLNYSSCEVASFSRRDLPLKQVKSYVGDIVDLNAIQNCILDFRPEIIIHLAGCTNRSRGLLDLENAMDINVKGTLNILKSVIGLKNFKKLIVMGTGEEYGQNATPFSEEMREMPVSCYSLSKTMQTHMVEMFSRSYDIPCVLLRPSIIYGPGQNQSMFLPSLIYSLNENKTFSMTSGKQSRDFIYVSDVIEAIVKSLDAEMGLFEIINIASGSGILISELADTVGIMLDKNNLIKKGALPLRPNDISEYCLNIEKAKDVLNWAPKVSLKLGLRETINFYCKSHESA
jgi:UDP-glucose 4-epimerase